MGSKTKDARDDEEDSATALRIYTVEELFAGAREIAIRHAGGLYRLSLTRQGKLILTK